MYRPQMDMKEENEYVVTVPLAYDRKSVQRSNNILRLTIGSASCLGVLVVLAYFQCRWFTRWDPRAQSQMESLTQATCILPANQEPDNTFDITKVRTTTTVTEHAQITTHPNNLISRRNHPRNQFDGKAIANIQDDSTQTEITDSDGTWVIVTTQELTDSDGNTWIPATQELPTSWTTTTSISTASLTDLIIISWKTKTETEMLDHFVTITVTGKNTAEDHSSTTATTDDPGTIITTTPTSNPQPPTSQLPSPTSPYPATCPYLTCAPTCPWNNTCFLPPTIMDPTLCQMIDPCWNHSDKPPSQGNKCACLCESGYCHNTLKKCAEKNCCHECGCYADNPMSLQQGIGKC